MSERIGILLINLGTPEATDFWSMRRYLKEFLSDKRVIEAKGPIWWTILNGFILTVRPGRSAKAYDKIWNREFNESPLKTITRAQCEKLAEVFANHDNIRVEWAMRYGHPATAKGIENLQSQGCQRILLFPLYPQYAGATTATALDKAHDAVREIRHQPELRSVAPYYADDRYITALADSIEQHGKSLDWKPDVILASFHGLPVAYITKGDPYQDQCQATAELLRRKLGLNDKQFRLTYQSRMGREEWIGPGTEETLIELAKSGTKNVLVITPGFAADCVETLEEIQIEAGDAFLENGGENFTTVACLNDSEQSVEMLKDLVLDALPGWHSEV